MEYLISIITPTYNCAQFIGETIKSVINQTYTNWEMIIVDDASNDNTEEVVKSIKDERIKYIRLKENSGAATARNIAMENASGKFMAFLDSDDIWIKDKLEKQVKFMIDNNYNFTCTAYEKMNEKGDSLNKVFKPKKKADYNRILLDCPVGNSTVMYNVSNLGKFQVPNIRKRNDDALWLQILKKEKFIYGMPDILMKYRIRNNSISSNKLSLVKYHWYLYRKIEHLSVIRSVFHICWWGIIKILHIK
jgi:teichuronic acid biosynthesis glycosyltransferase TuaG